MLKLYTRYKGIKSKFIIRPADVLPSINYVLQDLPSMRSYRVSHKTSVATTTESSSQSDR